MWIVVGPVDRWGCGAGRPGILRDVSPSEPSQAGFDVVVRRSSRRRKTVSAFLEHGRLVVAIPARFTLEQERHWVAQMSQRVARSTRRSQGCDTDLLERAETLAQQYLPSGARPVAVSWSSQQGKRWGSCTPMHGTIRLSDRLRTMPQWVQDYVLVHELAHLVVSGHGQEFWAIVNAYPRTERARGFLEGVSYREAHGLQELT